MLLEKRVPLKRRVSLERRVPLKRRVPLEKRVSMAIAFPKLILKLKKIEGGGGKFLDVSSTQ